MAKFTVTLKGGGINDPWIIIKTNTADELEDALIQIQTGDIPWRVRKANDVVRQELSNE